MTSKLKMQTAADSVAAPIRCQGLRAVFDWDYPSNKYATQMEISTQALNYVGQTLSPNMCLIEYKARVYVGRYVAKVRSLKRDSSANLEMKTPMAHVTLNLRPS